MATAPGTPTVSLTSKIDQDRHAEIHGPYHILQSASMIARYESNSNFFAQFDTDNMPERILARLEVIEAYLLAQFGA